VVIKQPVQQSNGGAMRTYALAHAGTTWFSVTSVATYGGGQQKHFPVVHIQQL
jgi:hypothetical protein